MTNSRFTPSTLRIFTWLTSGLFLWAGLVKIISPGEFAQTISDYALLPISSVHLFAIVYPWWEVAAGSAVLLKAWRQAGAMLLIGLSSLNLLALLTVVIRGLNIDCGCFGLPGLKAGWLTMIINIAVLMFSLALVLGIPKQTAD
jgi:putative oxidoreductase